MRKVQARWYHKGRISPVRLIVVHSMEWPERVTTAEDCARMFATMSRQASAHICVDNNTVVRCVEDRDTAWAAPGANADGLQMELAGYARQTKEQWLDDYGKAMLGLAAEACAAWCKKYDIPVRRLTRSELKAGKKGFTSHADISAVYKRSDHSDPGAGFPWDWLLAEVRGHLGQAVPPPSETGVAAPAWPGRYLTLGARGNDVKVWQRRMRARGWVIDVDGVYGPQSTSVAFRFQGQQDLDTDGIVGPATWEAAWSKPVT